jgi:small subunit ribosomal protein S4e
MICREKQANLLVDGRIRKDPKFPLGLMDVLSIPRIKKNYRVLIDVKGRFVLNEISNK